MNPIMAKKVKKRKPRSRPRRLGDVEPGHARRATTALQEVIRYAHDALQARTCQDAFTFMATAQTAYGEALAHEDSVSPTRRDRVLAERAAHALEAAHHHVRHKCLR